jgi:hypothetical protein
LGGSLTSSLYKGIVIDELCGGEGIKIKQESDGGKDVNQGALLFGLGGVTLWVLR